MTAVLMPGGPVADAVFVDLVPRIEKLRAGGHTPGLATVLIGDDEPSARYVAMKMRKAEELGCNSPHVHLPHTATTADRPSMSCAASTTTRRCDAMLVQHPAPPQVDYDAVLMAVDPDKDVDGMHPTNVGRLALGIPGPVSCTPAGIEAILTHYDVPVAGRNVVIVGRGVTIGRPLQHPAVAEAADCQRRGDSRAHRRARLGRLHQAGRHPHRRGRRARDDPARARHGRVAW